MSKNKSMDRNMSSNFPPIELSKGRFTIVKTDDSANMSHDYDYHDEHMQAAHQHASLNKDSGLLHEGGEVY